MPQRDQTGPMGQGPMTGRGMGICRGFGFRRWFRPVQFSEADEKKMLEAELKEMEAEKTEIQKRLKELK